ncbi:hypothetical protein [Actinoplanes aureus]|uniref:Uncharacterized protein n=1 Tax=Actinoplanes aureus TaxID=2792083 RepID=A0A931C8C1_9ACTN|nr:hypothetical protein [Actinoplanes aureus]MBG0560200.1 hypothetical protein [Actinoplanes aureus]
MTTDSVPAGADPRRLLSDVRALAHRVRLDQRLTWVALLVLAVATFVAIPFDYVGMDVRCVNGGSECQFSRDGVLYYWPAALLIAYTAIAFCYVRAARARGLGARVLPYALTGAALAVVFTTVWLLARVYLADPPTEPFPGWVMVLDRLVAPAGTIGVALLVLARLERNVALLVFTLGYLAVVLVPIDFGWTIHSSVRAEFIPQQVINGVVLLLGAAGFAIARRRQR